MGTNSGYKVRFSENNFSYNLKPLNPDPPENQKSRD
jgi:hypothetical protein